MALIGIAHPDFREELKREFEKIYDPDTRLSQEAPREASKGIAASAAR